MDSGRLSTEGLCLWTMVGCQLKGVYMDNGRLLTEELCRWTTVGCPLKGCVYGQL